MSIIGVAHLVRAKNGIEPFRRFLDSYRAHPAGCDHELLLLCKGFRTRSELQPYQELLHDIRCRALWLPDVGFDIRPYFVAARRFSHPYFCFLNSYSVILADGWLAKLYCHITRPGVGLVGATSSYLSLYDNLFDWSDEIHQHPNYQGALGRARLAVRRHAYQRWFPAFPNPFIRTNAFMMSRDVLLRVCQPALRIKVDANRFESGVDNLTIQVRRMGLRALVVGRDGVGYEQAEWPYSNTFMQHDQGNLLVSDNRTIQYANADIEGRWRISHASWGDAAQVIGAWQPAVRR